MLSRMLWETMLLPLTWIYQVCAVRSLCAEGVSKEKKLKTRRLLESFLEKNPYVVCFFSWITAFSEGKHGKKNRWSNKDSSNSEVETVVEQIFCPGISLWVVFNWLDSGLVAFAENISKDILAADLRSCKAIRRRGKFNIRRISFCFYLNIFGYVQWLFCYIQIKFCI